MIIAVRCGAPWRAGVKPRSVPANGKTAGTAVAEPKEAPARAEPVQGLKLIAVTPAQEELFRTSDERIEQGQIEEPKRRFLARLRVALATVL